MMLKTIMVKYNVTKLFYTLSGKYVSPRFEPPHFPQFQKWVHMHDRSSTLPLQLIKLLFLNSGSKIQLFYLNLPMVAVER